jgi:DNA topoisomerase-1
MIHATINTVGVDLEAGKGNVFRATGSTIVDPGFMSVYQEDTDDGKDGEEQNLLPELATGETVKLETIHTEQHFTEPPPRYTEASLIKTLEEYGIGRPSTYAAIIATLQQREYVVLDKKRFKPTDVGRIVNKFLTEHFSRYVDYEFTAKLEDELDAVSRGEEEWIPLMRSFWQPFKQLVDDKEKSVQRKDVTQEALDELCPKCGKPLSIRLGKRGRFVGCTGFPECDYTRNLGDNVEETDTELVDGRICPTCSGALVVRTGPYGKFIGCSNYPKCKYIEPLVKPSDTRVACPKCRQGTMLQRRSRRGKTFYSCSRYPSCDYAVWNEPVAIPCPNCQWPILTVKSTKKNGAELVCPQKDCGHSAPYEESAEQPRRAAQG